MTTSRLILTRPQILAFRRRVGALDERLPTRTSSLERAAWAGLQDSMPRAALLSIHARVERIRASSWEAQSLVQLWGPRYHAYVVARRDLAIFSLGRLPDGARVRRIAEDLADRLHALLDGGRMTVTCTSSVPRRPTRSPDGRASRREKASLRSTPSTGR